MAAKDSEARSDADGGLGAMERWVKSAERSVILLVVAIILLALSWRVAENSNLGNSVLIIGIGLILVLVMVEVLLMERHKHNR